MKVLYSFIFMFMLFTSTAFAQTNTCSVDLPLGTPSVKQNVKPICKTAYVTAYDYAAKIPSWVAYNVSPDHAIGCGIRLKTFYVEKSVPVEVRSRINDYKNSGYDIGHLADAASMSYDPTVSIESFTLSNTSPQDPSMNRGIWSNLELRVRVWAFNGRSLSIYTGGIYGKNSKKIGNNVVVPDKFFKVIVDNKTNESLAFIIANNNHLVRSLNTSLTSIENVEKQSGLVFPVVGDKSKINSMWILDAAKFRLAKQSQCSN